LEDDIIKEDNGAKLFLVKNSGDVVIERDIANIDDVSSIKVGSIASELYLNQKEKNISSAFKTINNRRSAKKEFGEFVFSVLQGDVLQLLDLEIPSHHVSKIFYLSSFVDDDGYLKKDGIKLKRHEVVKLLKIAKNTATRFMNNMTELEVLNIDDNKNVKLNKKYFIKGEIKKEYKKTNDNSNRFIKVFNDAVRELYNYHGISKISNKRKYLAFYHAMVLIPFISQEDTILRNKNGDLITIRYLLQILGIENWHYKRFTDSLSDVKFENGEPFAKLIIESTKTEDILNGNIVINPRFMYNGNSSEIFESHKDYIGIRTNEE
jgi:hypothetical protein